MNDLTPVTREEIFLAKLGGQDVETPSPVTREEQYLDYICGNSGSIPNPITREETYLSKISGADVDVPTPQTRIEMFLSVLAGEDVETPTPQTRLEMFLADWLNNNGEFLTVTGAIATFTTLRSAPLRSLAVTMGPKQDLNGYSYPWLAGGGKNVLPTLTEAQTVNGVTATPNADGSITLTGAASAIAYFDLITGFDSTAYAGYIVTGLPDDMASNSSTICYRISTASSRASLQDIQRGASGAYVSNTIVDNGTNLVFSLRVNNGYALPNGGLTLYPMMRASSASADFAPYSNICPISGWTGANVYHSGADTSDATTYSITFPSEAGTVYGGTLDVTTGKLTVNWAKIVLNGTQQISRENWKPQAKSVGWIYPYDLTRNIVGTGAVLQNIKCDTLPSMPFNSLQSINGPGIALASNQTYGISVMYPNTTLTTASAINAFLAEHPIDVVYELDTPQTYQLTPQEVQSLLGENNVWSDADSVTVTYRSN